MPVRVIHFVVGFAGGGTVSPADDFAEMRGQSGGIVLVPMKGECNHGHVTRTLISPTVITGLPRDTWQTLHCSTPKCRSKIVLKPDFEKMYGRNRS